MPRTILLDELQVSIRVPARLKESEVNRIRRTLIGKPFMKRLRAAIQDAVATFPALTPVRINLNR